MNEEAFQILTGVLLGAVNPDTLPDEQRNDLILKGALIALEEDASESAIQTISQTALRHPNDSIRRTALQILERLSLTQSTYAIDGLFHLVIETELLAARQWIESHSLRASTEPLQALFLLFTQPNYPITLQSLDTLTQGYWQELSEHAQLRAFTLAGQKGLRSWVAILSMESGLQTEHPLPALKAVIALYPTFQEAERTLTLQRLRLWAAKASHPAQEAITSLFIQHEDAQAKWIALQEGYLPADSVDRAVFLFLAEQWAEYEAVDFDSSLLLSAYETAIPALRRRLLEWSRHTGHTEWLRSLSSMGEVRWPQEMTDADWGLARQRLTESQHWEELWRLMQVTPPIWSARIIEQLAQVDWQPTSKEESGVYQRLAALAHDCLSAPLVTSPTQMLTLNPSGLNCLAVQSSGRLIACGGQDPSIYSLTRVDDETLARKASIATSSPVIRALAFSPDGQFLAAATGDHRIRIIRLDDGAVIKTMEGHHGMIRALAIDPESRLLASTGFDGSIRLWRFPFGPQLKVIELGKAEIFSLGMAKSGQVLVSAGADCQVRAWSLPEGNLLRSLEGHTDTITNLAVSSEGDLAVSAARNEEIRVWNVNSGRLLRSLQTSQGAITALGLHPNEQMVIAASQASRTTSLALWSLSTGQMLDELKGHKATITGMALSADGNWLYSCDLAGALFAWNLQTQLLVRTVNEITRPGSAARLQEMLKNMPSSATEKKWLSFCVELARWRQRFDILLNEIKVISIGEFDIEL